MKFLPRTRQVQLESSSPERLISATPGTFFYRVGNDLFYLIKNGNRKRIEISKRGFALKYQNEMWYPTIQDSDIIFENTYEIWQKIGNKTGTIGWTFISYKSLNVTVGESLTPIATPTPTPTPTQTATPTPTPTFPEPQCAPLPSGSMYFNGNSYLQTQSGSIWNVGSGDFTFEWYMKQSGSGNPIQDIFYFGGPSDGYGHMSARLSYDVLSFAMNKQIVASGSLITPATEWTHIAISHRDNKLHMYQDGLFISSYVLDLNSYVTSSEHPLSLGGSNVLSSYVYFRGYITNFHYVKGVGLYNGVHSYGDYVFDPPVAPIVPVSGSKLLMLVNYPCDVGYNSIPDINLSKYNNGVLYSPEYPPVGETPTPTPTPTPTSTPTPTATPPPTPTSTPTPTPTSTDIPAPTSTPTQTSTPAPTSTPTPTPTSTDIPAPTSTPTPTPTPTNIIITTTKAIFGYGYISSGFVSMTNLVGNTGVVETDTTGVGTARSELAASGYGGDKAIFGYGQGSGRLNMTNLVSNTGVVSNDTTGVGTSRTTLAAAGYGGDKAIFGYGYTGVNVSMTNLVSNIGVVATDTTGVGTARHFIAAAGYGGDKAIFGFGNGLGGNLSTTNLVNNTGVVATDTAGVGTGRYFLAAASYGTDKAIFGYGAGSGVSSLTNLVSNTGVVATDTAGVGSERFALAAAGYGNDKAIFGYGRDIGNYAITNRVSNTGVVATDTAGVGTARQSLAAAGYSTL